MRVEENGVAVTVLGAVGKVVSPIMTVIMFDSPEHPFTLQAVT
jgi:hypothetical protein